MPNLIIPPRDLPSAPEVFDDSVLVVDTGAGVFKATPAQVVDVARPFATIQEAEDGVASGLTMTPLTTAAAITAQIGDAVAEGTAGKIEWFVTFEQFDGSAAPGFDNTAALAAVIASDLPVNLLDREYEVPGFPADVSKFFNGRLVRTTDDFLMSFDPSGSVWRLDGYNWQSGITPQDVVSLGGAFPKRNGNHRGVFAAGAGALQNAETDVHSIIAIGSNTISQAVQVPRYNIAIGDSALTDVVATGGGFNGTRNIGIGSLAGHFLTTGYMNVLMGRDTGHNLLTATECTAIGYQAMTAGVSPVGWSGGIELQFGGGAQSRSTAVGALALRRSTGSQNAGVGFSALPNIKAGADNIAIGPYSGEFLDANISWGGKDAAYDLSNALTYTATTTSAVFTLGSTPAIGIAVGDTVAVRVSSGPLEVEQGKAVVTARSGSTFTIANPVGVAGSGSGTLWAVEKTTDRTPVASARNILAGRVAARRRFALTENVIIGDAAMSGDAVDLTGLSLGNVILGTRAAKDHTVLTECTAIGHNAMRWMVDGSSLAASIARSSALGTNSRVSGDDQIQLGGPGTTPYAYAALQVRSDERDKADIEPTALGLDFIERIQPVQYRWDMRDDYVGAIPEDQRAEWWSNPVKDGSKKRKRMQQGVIAQQVRDVCEEMGVDFSGLQDHAINGGADVLTVGYEHFVPALIRAVHELSARLRELEKDA